MNEAKEQQGTRYPLKVNKKLLINNPFSGATVR
jgi:hypothetical protein